MDNKFLKKNYADLEDSELLFIVDKNSKEYTNEAIKIAKEEISKRMLLKELLLEVSNDNDKEANINHISNNRISAVIKLIGILEIVMGAISGFSLIPY